MHIFSFFISSKIIFFFLKFQSLVWQPQQIKRAKSTYTRPQAKVSLGFLGTFSTSFTTSSCSFVLCPPFSFQSPLPYSAGLFYASLCSKLPFVLCFLYLYPQSLHSAMHFPLLCLRSFHSALRHTPPLWSSLQCYLMLSFTPWPFPSR